MNNLRPALFALLAVILFFIWSDWEHRLPPAAPPVASNQIVPTTPGAAPAPTSSTPAPAAPTGANASPQNTPKPSGQDIVVKTDTVIATLNTQGGNLTHLLLRHYFADHSHGKHLYPLLQPIRGPHEFINENGLLGHHHYPNQNSLYTTHHSQYQLAPGHRHVRVHFHWAHGLLRVTKTYVFTRGSYVVAIHYLIQNLGKTTRHAYLYNQFIHGPLPKTHFYHSEPIYIGAALYTPAHKYHQLPFANMRKHPLHRVATGGWVGVSQHYFLGAALPPIQSRAIFYSAALPGPRYLVGYKSAHPLAVLPGTNQTLSTRLFLGPKKPSLLKATAPGLGLTVDYGWLTVLAQPLYWVLAHIERFTGNWGVAIILLTVMIKAIFFPLSATSFKSMAKMRKLQPRMAALKERHGADKGALQQAMMDLYKQEKMNPLGGCLPMIVQIPVFIALYWVLLDSVALRDAPFILWIHNLAAPDPYFVLPILMGISMLLQQMLNPAMMDPTQRKIMMVMPVIFTVFFLFFPAGLVLYWVINNVLSILQQWWVMARMERA
ncbi:MAG: membrane protein insertase YidC [Acidiferrobacter sp.]